MQVFINRGVICVKINARFRKAGDWIGVQRPGSVASGIYRARGHDVACLLQPVVEQSNSLVVVFAEVV